MQKQPRVAVVHHHRFPGDPHLCRNVHALRDAGLAVDVICDREPNLPRYERDVIGDGEYRPDLEHLAASLNLGDVASLFVLAQ